MFYFILIFENAALSTVKMTNESYKDCMQVWWNGIKSLPETTSIHGFRFIGDRNRHWTERYVMVSFRTLLTAAKLRLVFIKYFFINNLLDIQVAAKPTSISN